MKATTINIATKQMLKTTLTGLILILLCANVQASKPVKDSSLGLSKTSVNDSPVSEKFSYSDKFPGTSNVLPRAYPGAPAQIPHNIESFLPVTSKNNACKMCHDNPSMQGKKVKGQATAIPASHYTDLRFTPGKVTTELIGARYVCTQCHVPQANVKPLVTNTFND
jgi:cytochrome c-type protein NapB